MKGKRATATLKYSASEFCVITNTWLGLAGRTTPQSVSGCKFQACLFASYGGWVLAPVMVCALHTADLHECTDCLRLALSPTMPKGRSISEAALSLKPQYTSFLDLILFFPAFWEWKGKTQVDMCIWTETRENTKPQGHSWVSSHLPAEMPAQRLYFSSKFTHSFRGRKKAPNCRKIW